MLTCTYPYMAKLQGFIHQTDIDHSNTNYKTTTFTWSKLKTKR